MTERSKEGKSSMPPLSRLFLATLVRDLQTFYCNSLVIPMADRALGNVYIMVWYVAHRRNSLLYASKRSLREFRDLVHGDLVRMHLPEELVEEMRARFLFGPGPCVELRWETAPDSVRPLGPPAAPFRRD
jgi:hypothetical protein